MSAPIDPPPHATRRAAFIYGIIGLVVAVLILGTGAFVWLSQGGTASLVGGPFALEDGNGKQVSDRDFRGRYMLVYFGYTYCPDVCPTTLNDVADALDRLGAKADRLQPIFITVDPKRDTTAVMKQYTAAFTPRLIGLTGSQEQIADVAREYRVYYAEHRIGPGPNDYAMDHSSVLYLMGPDGKFIAPIEADEDGAHIAADLTRLMS
ncbi:MAG: SCO family protein [Acetobacteraceae bacterium]|jgi:protein SCO1